MGAFKIFIFIFEQAKNPHTTPPLASQLLALSIVCSAISMALRKFLFFAQFVTIFDIG
jgi:hypothetical protein